GGRARSRPPHRRADGADRLVRGERELRLLPRTARASGPVPAAVRAARAGPCPDGVPEVQAGRARPRVPGLAPGGGGWLRRVGAGGDLADLCRGPGPAQGAGQPVADAPLLRTAAPTQRLPRADAVPAAAGRVRAAVVGGRAGGGPRAAAAGPGRPG